MRGWSQRLFIFSPHADEKRTRLPVLLPGGSPSPPIVLRYLREYVRLSGAGNVLPSSLLPELLRARGLNASLGEDSTGSGMVEFLAHALAAEERRRDSDNAGNSRDSMPPWLLLALMSVAQGRGPDSGKFPASFEMGRRRTGAGGGDPATGAPAAELRSALESRVTESLRSVDRVRALLPDRGGSALPQGLDRVGVRAADDSDAAKKLAQSSATVDPATALFEGTLRQWLACRRKDVENEGDVLAAADDRVTDRSARGSERVSGRGGSRPAVGDALALAFRCEAAGGSATQVGCVTLPSWALFGMGTPLEAAGPAGEGGDVSVGGCSFCSCFTILFFIPESPHQ